MEQGRARSIQGRLAVKVALEDDRRAKLHGEVVAFDRFWMRVKLEPSKATAREGSSVGLEVASLDGEPPIQVHGIVWRAPGDGLITVLLSLSGQEFSRLKGLVSASVDSRSARPPVMRGLVSSPPRVEAPISWRRSHPTPPVVSPAPEPESPAGSTEPEAESPDRGSASESEARRPVPRRARRPSPSPAEEAALLAARGDHEEAARLYSEALREAPGDVSLWYALGAALHHLGRWREAAEAFECVVRHGRPDSREVRHAQLWLQRSGISGEPAPAGPDPERSEASPTPKGRTSYGSPAAHPLEAEEQVAPVEAAVESSEPSLAQQGAMLEAEGEYRRAAKLYYQALHAAPLDVSLWYALGAIMHRLNQSKAATRAFEKVVQHGQPDSREVQLARLWLEGRDVLAERTAPDVRAEPEQPGRAGMSGASVGPRAKPSVASVSRESNRLTPEAEVPPARSSSARQAALLAARGDYEGAARLYFEAFQQALGAAPDDSLLWYVLGVTLQHLNQGKAAAPAFEKVLRYGRPDSREVRLARLWLEIGDAVVGPVGVEPDAKLSGAAPPAEAPSVKALIEPETPSAPPEPRAQPSGRGVTARREASATPVAPLADPWELGRAFERDMPVPAVETRVKGRPSSSAVQREDEPRARSSSRGAAPKREAPRQPASGRTKRSGPSPGEEAAIVAARGDYEEAARLYSDALQAAPEDVSLWYALGVTLRRLRRWTEAAEAFEYVVRHGRGSREAHLARVWLERGGIREEPGA